MSDLNEVDDLRQRVAELEDWQSDACALLRSVDRGTFMHVQSYGGWLNFNSIRHHILDRSTRLADGDRR